jgi:DNA-binding transcriptional LysR family regulator
VHNEDSAERTQRGAVELRQLRYFVVVAEELHFGRAAERLHIVASAVSQQVRRLEHELGVALFERTTRTVALTDDGRALLPHARRVLDGAAAVRIAADALRGDRAATVRLGTSTGLAGRLEAILTGFAERAPLARLELVTAPADERVRMLRGGALDAALLRAPGPDPTLDLLALWDDPLVVALPAAHPLAAGPAVEVAALRGLPLRLADRARNPPLHELVLRSCRAAGFEPTPGPAFTTDQDTLAAIGFGDPCWTVYYASQADRLAAPQVAFRPLTGPAPVMPTALALRREPPREQVRALIDACRSA